MSGADLLPPSRTPVTPDRTFGTFTPEGIVAGPGQAARPSAVATQATQSTRDDDNGGSSDMFRDQSSRAESARTALESSRSGRDEVLSNIVDRGTREGKSATEITNEVSAAARESSRVEGALRDISRGVQRGFNKGGLVAKKETQPKSTPNKNRGVAARKKN
jgi:hypothetical protein